MIYARGYLWSIIYCYSLRLYTRPPDMPVSDVQRPGDLKKTCRLRDRAHGNIMTVLMATLSRWLLGFHSET